MEGVAVIGNRWINTNVGHHAKAILLSMKENAPSPASRTAASLLDISSSRFLA
jgi:hypothetical protein